MAESRESVAVRLGLIVNPVAGMGGKVALKGTDGADALREAERRGAIPISPGRADRALARLQDALPSIKILAAAGPMGAELAVARGFEVERVGDANGEETTPRDTRDAAVEMQRRGVDLLLFAGGDGTARDIYDAIGSSMTVLGIPTGVKMHSGVFARSPDSAGDAAVAFLRRPAGAQQVVDAEVADLDEDNACDDRIGTRLYGMLRVPANRTAIVGAKAWSGAVNDAALEALARRIAREMEPERLYVIGPGTTTARVLEQLRLPSTLLGVDVVRDGRLVAADVGETELLELLGTAAATIIAGVVGGQGFLFGRGNQQISAEVIRRVGVDEIVVLADEAKLNRLSPPRLRVDTGDQAVDRLLTGYRKVLVGPSRATVLKIST